MILAAMVVMVVVLVVGEVDERPAAPESRDVEMQTNRCILVYVLSSDAKLRPLGRRLIFVGFYWLIINAVEGGRIRKEKWKTRSHHINP